MSHTPDLSDAKRALLDKYLRGEVPQTVMRNANIAHQSTETAGEAHGRVVAIQGGSSRLPFFFLHGQINGEGLFCFPLARDLGVDQSFYAVNPDTLRGLQVLPTLEAVASAHIESLRAIQPDGPYFLGGYCNGALVAFEIARQLGMQGHSVGMLALVDPMAPGDPELLRSVTRTFGDVLQSGRQDVYAGAVATIVLKYVGNILRAREDILVDCLIRILWLHKYLGETYQYLSDWWHRKAKRSRCTDLSRQGYGGDMRNTLTCKRSRFRPLVPSVEVLRKDYHGRFIWLASKYVAHGCPSKITFLWSGDEPINSYRRRAWREVVKGLDVVEHIVPGTHDSLRDEDLSVLAKRLRLCLDEAQPTVP